jgi:TPP-dependent pyruvate/acetoin dehydrogenase alpha subunit
VGEEAFLGKKAYRPQDEIAEWKKRCPLVSFENRYTANGMFTKAELDAIKVDVKREIDEAVQFAIDSPLPAPEEAMEDMFSAA